MSLKVLRGLLQSICHQTAQQHSSQTPPSTTQHLPKPSTSLIKDSIHTPLEDNKQVQLLMYIYISLHISCVNFMIHTIHLLIKLMNTLHFVHFIHRGLIVHNTYIFNSSILVCIYHYVLLLSILYCCVNLNFSQGGSLKLHLDLCHFIG